MTVVKAIFSNFTAFLMAIFLTCIPYKGTKLPVIDTEKENCNLTLELLSDTHIESTELFRQGFLACGLKNLNRAQCDIDAVLVAGDLTNYADDPSMAKYFDIISKNSPAPVISAAGNHDMGHAGDRDKTDMTREEARDNYIKHRNEYMGIDADTTYFSTEIKGYKFIVINDEVIDGGHWDAISMSDEQLAFLDSELAEGTKDGKPVFVLSHWPLYDTTAEQTVWPDSGIPTPETDPEDGYYIAPILEKYNNVYWISGHMHSGVKADIIDKEYAISSAEQVNGVTYLNLPTYGIINSFGLPWSCTGAQLEVYDNEVIFRPRNFITNNWYENAEYHFELVK